MSLNKIKIFLYYQILAILLTSINKLYRYVQCFLIAVFCHSIRPLHACMHACIILCYIWIRLKKYCKLWPEIVRIKLQCTELVLIPHECCYLHWYPTAKVFRARVLRKSKISLQPMHLPLNQNVWWIFPHATITLLIGFPK